MFIRNVLTITKSYGEKMSYNIFRNDTWGQNKFMTIFKWYRSGLPLVTCPHSCNSFIISFYLLHFLEILVLCEIFFAFLGTVNLLVLSFCLYLIYMPGFLWFSVFLCPFTSFPFQRFLIFELVRRLNERLLFFPWGSEHVQIERGFCQKIRFIHVISLVLEFVVGKRS